jgi:hypothetical protein
VLNPARSDRFGPVQKGKHSFIRTGRFMKADIAERHGVLNGNFLLHTLSLLLEINA